MEEWQKEGQSRLFFEISKEINKVGIIRFLELDNEKQAELIYLANKDKEQGIGLLMDLLVWKYLQTHKVNIPRL
jgi:hypothetical protein